MRRIVAALATLALLAAFVPSAAVAAKPDVYVYHGTLTGAQLTCGGEVIPVLTKGIWSATISPGMAQIDATEFHDWGDGNWVHQMAMGGAAWGKWEVVGTPGPDSFHMSVLAFGVIDVDATLSDGDIWFHLEPYGDCASADVWGELR